MLQGQLADTVDGDARLLADAMVRSKNAAGALEVAQAGNELTSLGVKQSLQLESLLAAEQRAQTFSRARDLATENEARQRFRTFLGSGSGYTASR
jgi:P-type conjugative transfer protein TrbJ